jgi:hypothetical protein
VRYKEVLHRANEQSNILLTVIRREANWIGHVLRRNCLINRIIKGKIEEGVKGTEEEDDVSSYRMSLKKREESVN